jgi:hypothetical protein
MSQFTNSMLRNTIEKVEKYSDSELAHLRDILNIVDSDMSHLRIHVIEKLQNQLDKIEAREKHPEFEIIKNVFGGNFDQ